MPRGRHTTNKHSGPIGQAELSAYLAGQSDFNFELRTLKLLRARHLECEHGGSYQDPLTNKLRTFDIRAIVRDEPYCVRLAVECKNVSEAFPLLVSCVPRQLDESFIECALVTDIERPRDQYSIDPMQSRANIVRLSGSDSLYRPREPVGKELVQVGRAGNDGAITGASKDVYEKWAQCLASAHDLIAASYCEGSDDIPSTWFAAVLPILVVPDGRLWVAKYDADGTELSEPEAVEQCNLYINHECNVNGFGPTMHLSHIEIVTLTGLANFVEEFLRNSATMQRLMPRETFEVRIDELRKGLG